MGPLVMMELFTATFDRDPQKKRYTVEFYQRLICRTLIFEKQ